MSFITKDDTVLVAIDFQEKLMPAMSNGEETEERAAKLIRGMKVFDIPAIVTQQYTKGIGPTTAKLSAELGDFKHVEKTAFSAMRMPEFRERLKETGRKNVVICGVEAHICVLNIDVIIRMVHINFFKFSCSHGMIYMTMGQQDQDWLVCQLLYIGSQKAQATACVNECGSFCSLHQIHQFHAGCPNAGGSWGYFFMFKCNHSFSFAFRSRSSQASTMAVNCAFSALS